MRRQGRIRLKLSDVHPTRPPVPEDWLKKVVIRKVSNVLFVRGNEPHR